MTAWTLLAVLLIGTAAPGIAEAGKQPAPPGAASCSGCHVAPGATRAVVPVIQGRPTEEIVSALRAYRNGERSPTVMDRIARGFSDEEIRAIALWLGAQK
jgi:sulfide dehydrogenase cytochrome subunit